MIKFSHKAKVIKGVHLRYQRQYCLRDDHPTVLSLKGATEEQINEIIGNSSWTMNKCDSCYEDSDILVSVGNPHGHDGYLNKFCRSCLEKSLSALIEEEQRVT